ncbi:hypothetical protein FKM82_031263 [Ascaphus truei]
MISVSDIYPVIHVSYTVDRAARHLRFYFEYSFSPTVGQLVFAGDPMVAEENGISRTNLLMADLMVIAPFVTGILMSRCLLC